MPKASTPVPLAHPGTTIRRLRLQQARTQQQIADACGFTKSLLSKIEAGRTSPPIATLSRIAEVLGTTLPGLLEAPHGVKAVYTSKADAEAGMTATEKGYAVYPFAAAYGGKRMQPFLFTARRGEVKEHALSHAGEEFVLVLEGEIRFRVGPTDYHLRPGDSLYFDAREPHGMLPVTATARYLDIFL